MTGDESNDLDPTASRRRVLLSTATALTGAGVASQTALGQSGSGPEVRIHPPGGAIYAGNYFEVQSSVTEGDATVESYEWDMGDGTTRSSWRTGHHYDEPGEYTITLTVTDAAGLTDTASVDVIVTDYDSPTTADVTKTFRNLPENEVIEVQVELLNPQILERSDVDDVVVEPASTVLTASTDGFREEDGSYVVQSGVTTPSVTMEIAAEEYLTDERDDLHLLVLDNVDPVVSVTPDGSNAVASSTHRIDGPGLVEPEADRMYFGEYTDVRFETDHGPTRLFVPETLDPAASLGELETALGEISAAVETGPVHEQILGHPLPPELDGEHSGFAIGSAFWTNDDVPADEVGSTWYHEFLHVADGTSTADSADWTGEAYAEYYEALLCLEIEHLIGGSSFFQGTAFRQFRTHVGRGLDHTGDLSNPDNLDDGLEYEYGALVVAAIDRRIRRLSADASFQDAWGRLHGVSDATHQDLLDAIVAVVADDASDAEAAALRSDADDWITGQASPDTWSVTEHAADFGYGVTEPDGATATGVVDGQRRELDPDRHERVDASEPVRVEVTVHYPDSSSATVTAEAFDDGNPTKTTSIGTAEVTGSGQAVTETFERQFDGAYWTKLEADVDVSGRLSDPPYDLDLGQSVVALEPDATLVRAVDDTTEAEPATVESGTRLALLLDNWSSPSAEVELAAVDGSDQHAVTVGENFHLATTNASDLQAGTTYEVTFPHPDDPAQYVEVASDRPEADENPHGEIDPTATTASVGESVSFGITQNTDYISQMEWSMGDGTTYGKDFWVSNAYDSPGTYYVTLDTKSGHDGSWTTDVVRIDVE